MTKENNLNKKNKNMPLFPNGAKIVDKNNTYTIIEPIGKGAYAQVFRVTSSNTGKQFALKVIDTSEIKSLTVREKIESEIRIHKSLNNPYIVKFYDSFRTKINCNVRESEKNNVRESEKNNVREDENKNKNKDKNKNTNGDFFIFIVLELCERGTLDEILKKHKKISERYVSRFCSQILKGLIYLHNEKFVVHRDLKLGNIFLDSNYNIKIGDFGLCALILDNVNGRRKTICGTPNYIAPEILLRDKKDPKDVSSKPLNNSIKGHSFEVDIWSLGCIIYTLLIGVPPFQRKDLKEIYKNIKSVTYSFPTNHNLKFESIDIIQKLLLFDPSSRLSLGEILMHKFTQIKETVTSKMYYNILTRQYSESKIIDNYVNLSFPMDKIQGIGYVCRYDVVGIIYFNDKNMNVFIKKGTFTIVTNSISSSKCNRRTFSTLEYKIKSIPRELKYHIENIKYFIKTFTNLQWDSYNSSVIHPNSFYNYDSRSEEKENKTHISINSSFPNIFSNDEIKSTFLTRIKRVKDDGILFIMSNNVFIFDFECGNIVVISEKGKYINVLNDDGFVKFDDRIRNKVMSSLISFLIK